MSKKDESVVVEVYTDVMKDSVVFSITVDKTVIAVDFGQHEAHTLGVMLQNASDNLLVKEITH